MHLLWRLSSYQRARFPRVVIGAVLLAANMAAAPDAAAETVRFPVATTPPTPLQERLARERGQPIAVAAPAVELTGGLYRPAGTGPFPAVVSLHGCAGLPFRAIADAADLREAFERRCSCNRLHEQRD